MAGINPFFIFLPLRRAKGGAAQEEGGVAQEEDLPSFILFLQRQIMTKRPISQLKRRHVLGPNVLDMFKKLQQKKDADATSEFSSSNEDEKGDDEEETLGKVVFQYKWLKAWKWMRYDDEIDAIFCTTCEAFAIACHSPYTKGGCQNFKTSSFREHGRSKGHFVAAARKADAEKPKKPVVVAIHAMHEKIDGAILNLFKAAYTVAARSWSFNDFQYLIDLLEVTGCPSLTKQLYHNDHACQEFIACISDGMDADLIEAAKNTSYFGLQVDESTDVATQQHIVLCVSYLENNCEPKRKFLKVLRVQHGDAGSLYNALLEYLQNAGFDMAKMVAFGSDGVSTMTGVRTGVSTRFKQRCPFLTSIHCIAHRTNLAVVDASKKDGMEWLQEIEKLINSIAAHFSCSSQRLEKFQGLLEEHACSILRLERIHQTRWLSRHSAVSKFCEDLPVILKYAEIESFEIFKQVANFRVIYLLHFLGDILGGLTILSKMFQEDYVVITSISAHVKTMDLAIDCYYIKDPPADLNAFLEDRSGYPIIPDYGPSGGHLEALRSSLHGKEYRGFEIVREKDGSDLELAIIQQKAFAKAICDGLNTRFEDASILKHFSVLSPRNLPNAMKSRKFGEESLKELTKFYGIAKDVAGLQQKVPPLVSETSLQREYSDYKIHAAANWHNMDLEEVCMAIASSPSNALRFKNVLTLLQIALVQCASNAICERIFSSRTSVKDGSRARMGVDSLNACLSIVVNGPKNAQDFNFERSLQIWKGKANRQIYTGESSRHLN